MEIIENICISAYPDRFGEYRFLIPKKGVTMLHNIWIEDDCTIKQACFIGCDLCHESLTSNSIELMNNRQYLPFFFTKAHGGFPMAATPYYEVGIWITLNEKRDESIPLKLYMCVSMIHDVNKFDKLVEKIIKQPFYLTYPNSTIQNLKLTNGTSVTHYVTTTHGVIALVWRVKDDDNKYIPSKDVITTCFINECDEISDDYTLIHKFKESGDKSNRNLPYKQDEYIQCHTFVPDVQNLCIPRAKATSDMSAYKSIQIKMEIDSRYNNAASIELMCVRYQDVYFGGGVFGIRH